MAEKLTEQGLVVGLIPEEEKPAEKQPEKAAPAEKKTKKAAKAE